jgi:hypothetical protein
VRERRREFVNAGKSLALSQRVERSAETLDHAVERARDAPDLVITRDVDASLEVSARNAVGSHGETLERMREATRE